jgi:nitrogen fixation protein NifU and related proteins
MTDLRELYQEVIFDHNRRPRNFGKLASANRQAEGFNTLCGDRLTLYLEVADDKIQNVAFEGSGCAISTASASLLTEALKGKSLAQAEALFQDFHKMLTEDGAAVPDNMGKLTVLAGVREFPARVKCATLSWHTLQAALHGEQAPVSTE